MNIAIFDWVARKHNSAGQDTGDGSLAHLVIICHRYMLHLQMVLLPLSGQKSIIAAVKLFQIHCQFDEEQNRFFAALD